jgi:hypothetical protein
VDYSLKDAFSNKRFVQGTTTKPSDCDKAMAVMLEELAGTKIDNSEVRSCEFKKEALVGLIWGPVEVPTPLTEGGSDWASTRDDLFIPFLRKLQGARIATKGLPIFMYVNGGSKQTLEYIDFIV